MAYAEVKQPKTKNTPVKIQFEYYAPEARQVRLAGTFNNWDAAKTPLKKAGEGRWKVSFELPRGRYEYRYLVDGEWQNGPSAVECVPNIFGTWNCVLEVK